jgi:hypothetical protein
MAERKALCDSFGEKFDLSRHYTVSERYTFKYFVVLAPDLSVITVGEWLLENF